MKRILGILLTVALLLSIVPTAAFAEEEKITVHMVAAIYSDYTEPFLTEMEALFEEANPNIDIIIECVGWDNLSQRMTSLVGANQAPDVYQGGSASAYIPDELVYNVKDILPEEFLANFNPQLYANNVYPDDGEVYMIPYLASVRALYYNVDIFEEVGIEAAPTTWAEVEEVCAKIKEFYNGDVYAWGLDSTATEGQTILGYYGWNNGGGYVDEDSNWIINCDANVEAVEWVNSLYTNGYTNENPCIETRDDMQKMLVADKMAMLLTACFFPALYPDKNIGIAAIPYNDANVDQSYTLAVQDCILFFSDNAKSQPDSDEKKAAIAAWTQFLYSDEYMAPYLVTEGLLPATNSGVEYLAEIAPDMAAYVEVMAGARFYARNRADWKNGTAAMIEATQSVLTGVMTAQEALDYAQEVCLEG